MSSADLSEASGDLRASADVCVVGAGPIGLTVVRRLLERGRSVVLLERGADVAEGQTGSGEIAFDGRPYGGAAAGRAFGFGGTSALWGGQLLPVMERELGGDPETGAPSWPIGLSDISDHYATLDRWLKVAPGPFELERMRPQPLSRLDWTGFEPRYSKWLGFGRRHIGTAWRRHLGSAEKLQIWLNARVVGFERDGRRMHAVTAVGRDARLTVSARYVVIAAGAIESTRLALSLFESPDLRPFRPAALGCYLHDHLSLRIARLVPLARGGVQALFAPRFLDGTMRTLRIELAADVARAARVPPAYAHIVADPGPRSGFAVARDLLRAVQGGRTSDAWRAIGGIPAALPELLELTYWRTVRRRLAFPPGAPLFLHIDYQQIPDIRNRIYLGNELDPHGCRRARVDWDIRDDGPRYVAAFQERIGRFWQRNGLHRTLRLEYLPGRSDGTLDPSNSYDIYHPAGTTRMAPDPESGCVDPDLRLFGTENVFIAGTSVLPAMGAANPTYTAMALGLRLADHLGSP